MKKQLFFCLVALCLAQGVWGQIDWSAAKIKITTEAELKQLAKRVNANERNFKNKTIILANNIDIVEDDWVPIGTSEKNSFDGIFDGNNNIIRGVKINQSGINGLFGFVSKSGTIKNLGVIGISIGGKSLAGGLVGVNHGTIVNCYVNGNISGGQGGGYDNNIGIGGLVGANYGTIVNSYVTGNVYGTDFSVGGLVGLNSGKIENSHALGNVTVGSWNWNGSSVGGLVGSNDGTITNCYAMGNVKGAVGRIGGLIGSNKGTITNCYATGNVSGQHYSVGGLVGNNGGIIIGCYATGSVNGSSSNVGGLVGDNSSNRGGIVRDNNSSGGKIENSYATGNVTGESSVGGLAGNNYGGTITNSYASGNVVGEKNSIGGLVGLNRYDGTVTNCYANGIVTGQEAVGGLVGGNGGAISNSYTSGRAKGNKNVGSLVGINGDKATINNSYALEDVSGLLFLAGYRADSESGVTNSDTKTAEQIKQQKTYKGWDFVKIWNIDKNINSGFPYLKAMTAQIVKMEKELAERAKIEAEQRIQDSIKNEQTKFTDSRDGKKYRTARIGNLTWMAENLNYIINSSLCYNEVDSNCEKYGRLYDWNMAMIACPKGWHLPNNDDWDDLIQAVDGEKTAGKKLKAKSGWNNGGNGTDEFGFIALPGGCTDSDGNFVEIGDFGYWWSATGDLVGLAHYRDVLYYCESSYNCIYNKSELFSVRCVKD